MNRIDSLNVALDAIENKLYKNQDDVKMKLDLDAPATFEEEKKDGSVPGSKPHINLKQLNEDLDDNNEMVDDEELARNLQEQFN